MSHLRKFATAGGTFAVALGIGFVMQNGDALAARIGGAETAAPSQAGVLSTPIIAATLTVPGLAPGLAPASGAAGRSSPFVAVAAIASPPLAALVATALIPQQRFQTMQVDGAPNAEVAVTLPADMTVPALPRPRPPIELATLDADDLFIDIPTLGDATDPPSAAPDCTVTFDGTSGPAATVDLVLSAPCSPGAVATIHHQGMIFSVPIAPDGIASVAVPALAEAAVFIADVNGVDGAVAVVTVPDFALYDRAVLQWQGDTGLQLHALEFGAKYSDQGHLWNASLSTMDASLAGDGGFMMQLGDLSLASGHNAVIYSYPSAMSARDGQIALSVEAEVTDANCGAEIAAQSIQIHPGTEPSALDLSMIMPGCDSIGEFLVLNGMLEDLTLIAR